jgi:hypothetical protein
VKSGETKNNRKSLAGFGIRLVLRNLPEWAGTDFKTGTFNRSAIRVASPASDAPEPELSIQRKGNRPHEFHVIVHTACTKYLVGSTKLPHKFAQTVSASTDRSESVSRQAVYRPRLGFLTPRDCFALRPVSGSVRSTIGLAAKVSILAALRLLRYAWSFENGNGVTKGLLIATEPSTPAVILRDDAAADKTLA